MTITKLTVKHVLNTWLNTINSVIDSIANIETNKLDKSGGTISGNLSVNGDINVSGNINAVVTGLTENALKAEKDFLGNILHETYATKSEISDVVRSVNNVFPDDAGNVELSLFVTERLNTTYTANANSTTTKTISGLTPNKPVYVVWKNDNTSSKSEVMLYFTSGTALDSGTTREVYNTTWGGSSNWACAIPIGTTLGVTLKGGSHTGGSGTIIAYQ